MRILIVALWQNLFFLPFSAKWQTFFSAIVAEFFEGVKKWQNFFCHFSATNTEKRNSATRSFFLCAFLKKVCGIDSVLNSESIPHTFFRNAQRKSDRKNSVTFLGHFWRCLKKKKNYNILGVSKNERKKQT